MQLLDTRGALERGDTSREEGGGSSPCRCLLLELNTPHEPSLEREDNQPLPGSPLWLLVREHVLLGSVEEPRAHKHSKRRRRRRRSPSRSSVNQLRSAGRTAEVRSAAVSYLSPWRAAAVRPSSPRTELAVSRTRRSSRRSTCPNRLLAHAQTKLRQRTWRQSASFLKGQYNIPDTIQTYEHTQAYGLKQIYMHPLNK